MCYFLIKPRLRFKHGVWWAIVKANDCTYETAGTTALMAWTRHRWGDEGYRTETGCPKIQ